MADHDDPKKFPNPAFLETRTLGTRKLADIDYDDERPTGVNPTSERPPHAAIPQPSVDPNDIFYLTDRPAKAKLPSFQDTTIGPGSLETPRRDLPPVAPIPRGAPGASPMAHSPLPPAHRPEVSPRLPVSRPWPPLTSDQAPAALTPGVATSVPIPLVSRTSSRPKPRKRRRGPWRPVVPAPRFPKSEPLFRIVSPRPEAIIPSPKPVEDRLLNALGVLLLGMLVATVAGFAFLTVTNTRTDALSSYITKPVLPPSFSSAVPAESAGP